VSCSRTTRREREKNGSLSVTSIRQKKITLEARVPTRHLEMEREDQWKWDILKIGILQRVRTHKKKNNCRDICASESRAVGGGENSPAGCHGEGKRRHNKGPTQQRRKSAFVRHNIGKRQEKGRNRKSQAHERRSGWQNPRAAFLSAVRMSLKGITSTQSAHIKGLAEKGFRKCKGSHTARSQRGPVRQIKQNRPPRQGTHRRPWQPKSYNPNRKKQPGAGRLECFSL